ncbi:hypothetical protein XVE_1629 [Xanthomonas vesicatoria ATCC 35937]|uniref:Uncharacterized protein n=1 Tax=Xanthomonas vesicatoria ATCC 35937 TaxID=925775 RepID=F0BC05_9XANT|nr:hypothetical protein XVE_1629 [Xanthomonas vesicatoria ATCC 35937]
MSHCVRRIAANAAWNQFSGATAALLKHSIEELLKVW